MHRTVLWLVLAAAASTGCNPGTAELKQADGFLPAFNAYRVPVASILEIGRERNLRTYLLRVGASSDVGDPRFKALVTSAQESLAGEPEDEMDTATFANRMFEALFDGAPDVVAATAHTIGPRGMVLSSPEGFDMPTPAKWRSLGHRVTTATTECERDDEKRRCVLIQLEPRGNRGSGGMTIAFDAAGE